MRMKKCLSVVFVMVILSTVYAYGRKNAEFVQNGNISISSNIKLIEESGIILGDGIGAFTKAEGNLMQKIEQDVYEAYLAANADSGYLFTYLDYDDDGRQELYLRRNEATDMHGHVARTYGYVMKYAAGGLKRIDNGLVSWKIIEEHKWKRIETYVSTDAASVAESTHGGVNVYIGQKPYGEDYFWYPDEQAFLSRYGLSESAPVYEHEYALPDGSMRLVLYYDEDTGLCCGLRYFQGSPNDIMTSGIYGCSFMGVEDEASAVAKAEEKLLQKNEQGVYEAYLAANADSGYLYVYLDYDNDGRKELCLRYNDDYYTYGYVMKYAAGGLGGFIDDGYMSEGNINGLEWKEIEADASGDTANTSEMAHEGVEVYMAQNPYGRNSFWYPDEQAFLSQYGFAESTPFYKYVLPNGSIRLVLYYDEQTGLGCGLRYYQRDPSDIITSGVYGFSFMGAEDGAASWTDRLSVDYTKFESCWGDGDTGSYYESYKENIEYDDAGRVAHYDSSGIIEEGEEPEFLLWMDYKYDDNGTLRQRQYYHNQRAFSTSYQAWSSYFDELGRLEHEDLYITHGSIDRYYIYLDEGAMPAYGLYLDNNLGWWIPEFVKF